MSDKILDGLKATYGFRNTFTYSYVEGSEKNPENEFKLYQAPDNDLMLIKFPKLSAVVIQDHEAEQVLNFISLMRGE